MHPAQLLAVKQEVLRSDTLRLEPWAREVLDSEDPSLSLQP
jgi:phosphotransferase system enzyme I (PtsI)